EKGDIQTSIIKILWMSPLNPSPLNPHYNPFCCPTFAGEVPKISVSRVLFPGTLLRPLLRQPSPLGNLLRRRGFRQLVTVVDGPLMPSCRAQLEPHQRHHKI